MSAVRSAILGIGRPPVGLRTYSTTLETDGFTSTRIASVPTTTGVTSSCTPTDSKLVEARVSYSRALLSPEISRADAEVLRAKLSTMNEDLLFSSKVVAGDPLVESYTVSSGDVLDRIRRDNVGPDGLLLAGDAFDGQEAHQAGDGSFFGDGDVGHSANPRKV